jgi:hypothetical protein
MKTHTHALVVSLLSLACVESSDYEIWSSDQSNSAPDQSGLGVKGSWVWIFGSEVVQKGLRQRETVSLACTPSATNGPCNTLDMFPQSLAQAGTGGMLTGQVLGKLSGFGRLHGIIPDPFNRYVNLNFFAPNGGFVGIVDTKTKEAIGLFQMSKMSFTATNTTGRSVHMSFWSTDGSAIIVANLAGKAIERIKVERDDSKTITGLFVDRSATLGLGKGMAVSESASFFVGNNAFGKPMLGGIVGNYSDADLSDLTPNGYCKETGCSVATALPLTLGGRPNNAPICPIISPEDNLYTTLADGGLFIIDIVSTPMTIIAEYESNVVQGAGCGGVMADGKMFMNAGVAAGTVGANESTFTIYAFSDSAFQSGTITPVNTPLPDVVFKDPGNTLTKGNLLGAKAVDLSGQLPNQTTRRDSHGMVVTSNGKYVHTLDRIQNTVEVFDAATYGQSSYDLTTFTGNLMSSSGNFWTKWLDTFFDGPCVAASVQDDPQLPNNDPAPDLSAVTPDGDYILVALRGPVPVSVPHGSQGSCPGIGVVKLLRNRKRGRLVQVIRTTNTLPDSVVINSLTMPGGHPYQGKERSDIHQVTVIPK